MLSQFQERVDASIEHFLSRINTIQGATLNTGYIDSIRVPYNEQLVPISELGFTSKSGNYVDIQVYDPALVGVITSAVQKQGHSVYSSKNVVRVSIPLASAETRDKNRKRVQDLAEEAKIACRQLRQEFRKKLLKNIKSEDEKEDMDKSIQEVLTKAVNEIEGYSVKKCEML